MSFDNPKTLFALILLAPFFAAMGPHYRKRRGVLFFLFPLPAARRIPLIREFRFRYLLSGLCFGLFLGGLIIALAGPRWGTRLTPEFRRGVDVVLAMDLSRSMDVRDMVSPRGETISRLDRGIAAAAELVRASGGIRFGVAIGKGNGILALPLTGDTEAVLGFLEGLSGQAITGRGTNLERLLDAAQSAFRDTFPTRRRIILFSDGEPLSGSLNAALDRALGADIAVVALGLGTERGGPVPAAGDAPATSFLRSGTLRNAAERTGGIYVDGSGQDAAPILIKYVASLGSESSGAYRREPKFQWHLFVIAALAALGMSKFLEKGLDRIGGASYG
ncbi:MAG: VWA domain-containing protein [Spirochaetaceae bacterium]|jgi:Ca-activated chloride channel family protein|nr:VWA domain-containing protein [Spirochaetaceae bacterium]